MKKIFKLLAITTLALSVLFTMVAADEKNAIPTPDDYDYIVHTASCFNTSTASTLNDLEQRTAVVIRGKVLENIRQDQLAEITGYTYTSVEVLEVLKGSGLTKGDVFELLEGYIIVEYNGEKILSSNDGYMPSDLGAEYIFFLNPIPNYENTYYMHNSIMGRYPVPQISKETNSGPQKAPAKLEPLKTEELPLNEGAAIKPYTSVYEEVFEAYIK